MDDTKKKALVTFSALSVVAVRIRGERREFPRMPEDNGIVGHFLQWMIKNDIHDMGISGHSGGGSFLGFFEAEDVPAIKKWLSENGAVEDDEKTWERRT